LGANVLEEQNRLIGYNNLQHLIIEPGFCTLCGACEAACPIHALKIENGKLTRIQECSEHLDLCPICYEICPHSEELLLRSLRFVSTAPVKSEALGYYRKIVLTRTADSKLREQSRGGGVVTSLLTYGVENKIFDSAIVSQTEPENPLQPKPSVALVPDDVLSAVGSKFFPSAVAKAFGSAVYEYGKSNVAFVGVPCQVLALRKLEAWQHKMVDNLKIIIGLFCFGTFSLSHLLEYISRTYKVEPPDIKRMYLAKKFVIQTEDRSIRIPIPEVTDHILASCRTCMDFTAELADISVGRTHPLKNWSIVIIRTKAGEDFFYDALEHGIIDTDVIEHEPNVFAHLIEASMQKRMSALEALKKAEKVYDFLPVRLLRETDMLSQIKVEEIMTSNPITVSRDFSVSQLLDLMAAKKHIAYPVLNEDGEPVGVVTVEDAGKVEKKKRSETLVRDIAKRSPVVAYPGETALDVFKRMSTEGTSRILVLDRANPKKLLGIVTKTDLMHTLTENS
jgi:coenzyme F420 hydrogenase subunit beta